MGVLFFPIFFSYLENLTHYRRERHRGNIIGLRKMGFSRESEGKVGWERGGENLRVGGGWSGGWD